MGGGILPGMSRESIDGQQESRLRPLTPELANLVQLRTSFGDEEAWREQALCVQTDPALFFPEKGEPTREAKRVCGNCGVRTACLADALVHNERFGVWGGLSERERRKLKK